MTEIKKQDQYEKWKTTKEVAESLGVSPICLRVFKNQNKQMFEGLITRSNLEREGKLREHLLWCPEAIKILALNISNPQVDQWKEDVVNENYYGDEEF